MFRLLQINFIHYNQLYPVHSWEYENFHEIHMRKIQITYQLSNKFEIILFGFDGDKKWDTTNVSDLNNIFKVLVSISDIITIFESLLLKLNNGKKRINVPKTP